MLKRLGLISIAVLLTVGLVACGGDDDGDGGTSVHVDLGEWFVTPSPVSVPAGDVTFDAHNDGNIAHELIVMQSDLAADALVVVGGSVDESQSGTVIGEIEPDKLPAGAEASATWNLAAGSYVLFCNIPGHYGPGMYAAFTVE